MNLSRVLRVSLVVAVAAAATVIACGGSDNKTIDAKVFMDAPVVHMDGSGSGSGGGSAIGKDCTGGGSGDATLCPASDPICTSLNGTKFFCTASCGTSACATGGTAGSDSCLMNGSNQPMPPATGDATCMQQQSQTTATPLCALYGPGSGTGNMAVAWACGLICGMAGSANYGTCPSNLTCTQNICQ